MFLEPLEHNSSLMAWEVVLLEDPISTWEDRGHVKMQLARNIVQIIRSFMICSTTTKYPKEDAQDNELQRIIPPPSACTLVRLEDSVP